MKEQKNQPEDMTQDKGERRHRNIMMVYLILYDAIAINFSYFFGLLLRFDFKFSSIPPEYFQAFLKFLLQIIHFDCTLLLVFLIHSLEPE